MTIQNHSPANRIIYAFYLLVLAWAPIPLGSNRAWAWSLLEAAVYLMVASIFLLTVIRRCQFVEQSTLKRNRWIVIVFCLHLAYLLIQCLPLPIDLITFLNPLKTGWFQTAPLVSNAEFATLSASAHHSKIEFYKQLAYVLMLSLTLCLIDSKKRLFLTVSVIISVSIVEAVYGVAASLMGESFTLWRPTDGPSAGGTFVNKNHFAAHLSFAVGLSIGLCLYFLRLLEFSTSRGKFRGLLIRMTKLVLTPIGFTFGVLLILMSGMFLSQSRGALIALLISVLVILALGVILHGRKSPEGRILPYILLITLFASFWLGLGNMFSSFVSILAKDTSRWAHWQQTWTMFTEHWFVGVGNGAYQYVFTQFKAGDYTHYLIDYAHNDHLQLLSEQGLMGALLWYAGLCLLFFRFLSAYFKKHSSRRYQCLLVGLLIALAAFFLHGFVDFNFHIPANALWFYAILGLGLVVSDRISSDNWPEQ
ncbi:MAG: putative inorganic carbon (HCO3(-)) transporter [Arenicella sp.]|jgi:putative inorganic carbon (HCO3(-)) transporter